MAEISELEQEHEYTIEFDDGSEYVHLYFADVLDLAISFVRFDALYEIGEKVDRKISGETVILPYGRVIRIVKRKPPE